MADYYPYRSIFVFGMIISVLWIWSEKHIPAADAQKASQSFTMNTGRVVQAVPEEKNEASPFTPLLHGLSNKYASEFNTNASDLNYRLAALIETETGNNKRFIPKSKWHKYKETGDSGNAVHAWQIDKRWHKGIDKKMSFEESGNYAIKRVLLPCYKRAKKRGFTGDQLWIAAYACYNSNQLDDRYTTHRYGKRTLNNYFKYA